MSGRRARTLRSQAIEDRLLDPRALAQRRERIAAGPPPESPAPGARSVAEVADPDAPKEIVIAGTEDDKGTRHGQLLMQGLGQSLGLNFTEPDWDPAVHIPIWAAKLQAFLDSDEAGLEFTSPHDGLKHVLTRHGAESVVAICAARTEGPVAPSARDKRIRLVRPDGALYRG